MKKKCDLLPRTYAIKGYMRNGPGYKKIFRYTFYGALAFIVLGVTALFVIYTV